MSVISASTECKFCGRVSVGALLVLAALVYAASWVQNEFTYPFSRWFVALWGMSPWAGLAMLTVALGAAVSYVASGDALGSLFAAWLVGTYIAVAALALYVAVPWHAGYELVADAAWRPPKCVFKEYDKQAEQSGYWYPPLHAGRLVNSRCIDLGY